MDTFIGGTPWTAFSNLVFSTGSASMFLPNDATLGLAGGTMLTDSVSLIGGFTNAYADSKDPFEHSFDRFFYGSEHFSTVEIGWTKPQGRIYHDNSHLTFWHVDESIEAGTIGGWGVAFSHIQQINENWLPFIRGGYADDGGSFLQKSLGIGFLYHPNESDQLGVGLNWGEVNETTFAKGLEDQITMEAYYRFQLTQQFAVTPNIEFIDHPALNPQDDSTWVFGLRVRLAL